ncbi:dihydroorotase [Sesbania bispinosa]|nr:dihydroorotase [Sesbania bispinosa]
MGMVWAPIKRIEAQKQKTERERVKTDIHKRNRNGSPQKYLRMNGGLGEASYANTP